MDRAERYVTTMTIRRWGRVVMYLLAAAAGALGSFGPPTLIKDQVDGWVAQSWALSLFVSGLVCLYGSITDRWIGEFAGLPLLFVVLGFFGIALYLSARDSGNFPVYAYALILLSFSAGLIARWQDVKLVKAQAEALGRSREGE